MYGQRIVYDRQTGRVLNAILNAEGDINAEDRPFEIDYIDLPYQYGDNNFKNVQTFHIDISKPQDAPLSERIVIDAYFNPPIDKDAYIKQLEDELLQAEGVI